MKSEWIEIALRHASKKADFYSGARKILENRTFSIDGADITPDLVMPDIGFTKSKSTMLRKGYVHEESRAAAVELWKGRLARGKYGSVGFHCFNHYVKGGGEERKSKRASVMGPCIQSVSITLLPSGRTRLNFFYRTTELFKKFPADLVFIRDELLAPFNFDDAPVESWNFTFANVTCHPMYFVTMLPHIDDPCSAIAVLRRKDPYFHDWAVKWTARYLCEEYSRGIQKFAQALRTRDGALALLDKRRLQVVQEYCRTNHPGYRGDNQDDGDD